MRYQFPYGNYFRTVIVRKMKINNTIVGTFTTFEAFKIPI